LKRPWKKALRFGEGLFREIAFFSSPPSHRDQAGEMGRKVKAEMHRGGMERVLEMGKNFHQAWDGGG